MLRRLRHAVCWIDAALDAGRVSPVAVIPARDDRCDFGLKPYSHVFRAMSPLCCGPQASAWPTRHRFMMCSVHAERLATMCDPASISQPQLFRHAFRRSSPLRSRLLVVSQAQDQHCSQRYPVCSARPSVALQRRMLILCALLLQHPQ